jgi:hypothetical protein
MKFKRHALFYVLRIMEVVMQLTVFVMLLMLAYAFVSANVTSFLPYLLVVSLPIVVLYFARRHVHQGILLIMIHVGVILYMLLVGNTEEEKIANVLVGIILMIVSINLRTRELKNKPEKMPVGLVGLFIVGVILGNYLELDTLAKASIYYGEVYILLQVIYRNFNNLHGFIQSNCELTTLPIKQMLSVNTFIMTILVTLCGGVMLLFHNSSVNHMLRSIVILIKDSILFVIKFLFSLFQHSEDKSVIKEKVQEKGLEELNELAKNNIWVDIINGIMMVLGIALVIIVVVAAIVSIVMAFVRLIRKMSSLNTGEDVKEFILSKEIREFRLRHHRIDASEKSTNAKIRKLYKSIVIKNAEKCGDKINASMVPRDISNLYIHGDQNTATDIYEKARYSNQQITQEEIEVLKEYKKR